MTENEFLRRMDKQLSIPPTAARRWISLFEEVIAAGQYADFIPKPKDEAMSQWLESAFAAFYFARQRGGESVVQTIIKAAELPHVLYPREIIGSLKYFRNGGQLEGVIEASLEGRFEYDGPLPTLADVEKDIKSTREKNRDVR